MKDTDSSIRILLFIAHFAKLGEHLRKLCFHCLIRKLTGSDCFMSAAVVFQHQASDIDIGSSVQDAVTNRCAAAMSALTGYME